MLLVSILGPVQVRREGVPLTVPAGRSGELLVRLALDAGAVVSTDRLLDELWADGAATTSRNTLQSKVARLRRALGDPSPVQGRDGGYVLDVDRFAIDAHAVARDAADATKLLAGGDGAGAADVAAAALRCFSGDLFPAVSSAWIEPYRARLEATRSGLLSTLYTARLQLGGATELIGELEAAVADQPFQEDLWGLLMTALYRAGRPADALAAYRRARRELADQLGLEPSPSLRDLEQRILDHDPLLAPAATPTPVSNLPTLGVELVGRGIEVGHIHDATAAHRLVEVVGPGGVGKTAVAIEVGRRLAASGARQLSGIWLVRLEVATTAGEVTDAVIAALGVTGGETALVERLKLGDSWLILDNCEHVVDHAAALAADLLDAAAGLHVLATSQVPFGLDGERVIPLEPLALDAAVELFGKRAESHGRPVGLQAGGAVVELCRSLDGLPLAIELAAARTRTLSVSDIIRRLDDRFSILSDPTSRRPDRRRALRSTISWSYDLLFPDDQRGLWALAAFAGGAPLEAVEHLLAALDVPVDAALDVLGRLAGRSLLIVDETPEGRARYRLLDSIRSFALDASRDAGQAGPAARAHAEWFAGAAAGATAGARGAEQATHLAFVRTERANIDAALTWSAAADTRLALRMAVGFGWAWIVLGDRRGADRLLTALDAAGEAAPPFERATALLLAGWIEASTGDLERARDLVERAAVIGEATGDVDLRARCCYHLAYVVSHGGRWQEALDLTDRAAELLEGRDRPWDRAANALFAARAAISAGDAARSQSAGEDVMRWLAEVEDPWLHVRGEAFLGELARVQHRFGDAVEHLTRAVDTSERLGFRQTAAYQLSSLGRAQCQTGDHVTGAETLAESIRQAEAIGDSRLAALIRVHLGRVRRTLGDVSGARAALDAASTWHRAVGGGEQAALGECLLAALDAADGAPGAAERLQAILEDARSRGDAPVEVFALDALARLASDGQGGGEPASSRAEADRRMEAAAHFITEADRVDAHAIGIRP